MVQVNGKLISDREGASLFCHMDDAPLPRPSQQEYPMLLLRMEYYLDEKKYRKVQDLPVVSASERARFERVIVFSACTACGV